MSAPPIAPLIARDRARQARFQRLYRVVELVHSLVRVWHLARLAAAVVHGWR